MILMTQMKRKMNRQAFVDGIFDSCPCLTTPKIVSQPGGPWVLSTREMRMTRMTGMKLIDDNEDAYKDNAQNSLPSWWSLGFVYTGMRITRMTKMKLIDDNNDANEDNCQDDLPYCWSLGFVSLMITMRWTEMMVMMVGGCS